MINEEVCEQFIDDCDPKFMAEATTMRQRQDSVMGSVRDDMVRIVANPFFKRSRTGGLEASGAAGGGAVPSLSAPVTFDLFNQDPIGCLHSSHGVIPRRVSLHAQPQEYVCT